MQYLHFTLLVLITVGSQAIASDIYKSRDEKGTVIYSDKQPDGDYEVIYQEKKKRFSGPIETDEPKAIPQERDFPSIKSKTDSIKADINAIYTELYRNDSDIQGEVKVTFTITQQGTVTNCEEDESQMQKSGFNGKICQQINRLNYGPVTQEQPTNVNFIYTFKPVT